MWAVVHLTKIPCFGRGGCAHVCVFLIPLALHEIMMKTCKKEGRDFTQKALLKCLSLVLNW
jgi:hypothetical protein